MDLRALLETHFGYSTFRPTQEQIVNTVVSGQNCMVVMPTGGGKSLCYQLPALCLPGITLVISPLIALMKDQVDGLRANGIGAAFLNSSQSADDQDSVMRDIRNGDVRLLYVAPERLAVPAFQSFLRDTTIGLIAIDEAHCISEWGHEFRPDYRLLTKLRASFPDVPCIALTATATPQVCDDIRMQLNIADAPLFMSSFNRPNLTYHVYPKARAFQRLLLLLKKPNCIPAIVYCFSRKSVETLAADLNAEGFKCLPYHAGLTPEKRRQTQDAFMRDDVQIITATVAFGMGIDKPDVRTVVHMDLPKNVEGYYQETGRAGRDGLQSDCILFYSEADRFKQEYFIRMMDDPEQQRISRNNLEQMVQYGELRSCRRKFLLSYFHETVEDDNCQSCDRCLSAADTTENAAEIARTVLTAIVSAGQRFGSVHMCNVLRGTSTERTRMAGHDGLSVFGSAREKSVAELKHIINELVNAKLLMKADGMYPTLSLTHAGQEFLESDAELHIRTLDENLDVAVRMEDTDEHFNADLFEELRTVRKALANKQQVAAYVIFGDKSLKEMASFFPQTDDSFQKVYGVSQKKLEQYGSAFMTVIRDFAALHNLQEREMEGRTIKPQKKATVQSGSTVDETSQLLRQGLSLTDIAKIRHLKEGTIIQHIETLTEAGTCPDISHIKPEADVFQEIEAAYRKIRSASLSMMFRHFAGKYSYDTLRLVRMFMKQEDPVSL